MKKIISVVGARPNFMKISPIHKAFARRGDLITHLICHTGQHYDEHMSKVFFEDLEIPKPHYNLGIGGGGHSEQTGKIMIKFDEILVQEKPDMVLVVGDVNSTIACGMAAVKRRIPLVHVEAGLRSFDRSMPEEINRILTDSISDYLFVTEESGMINLRNEGADENRIFNVGNVMIDSLVNRLHKIETSDIMVKHHLEKGKYVVVTVHRPANVDSPEWLENMIVFVNHLARHTKVVFPMHPRTNLNMEEFKLFKHLQGDVIPTQPMGYLDFIKCVKNSKFVVTDSGGIQEETTFLGVPCVTLRDNTERPVTVEVGTNHLAGTKLCEAAKVCRDLHYGEIKKQGKIPKFWDGKAAERIVNILIDKLYEEERTTVKVTSSASTRELITKVFDKV